MQPELDPDIDWVVRLSGEGREPCERAVAEAARDVALFRHIAREHDAGGRPGYVEIDAPLELYALTRLLRPRHVVEVGVSSGVSSAYLLRALARNGAGTLHSIDRPSVERRRPGAPRRPTESWALPAGRHSGWAVPFPLRGRWDLRLGDKADVIPLLAEELPAIDLFVYDVPHNDSSSWQEFRTLDPRCAPGAVAIADHGPHGELCSALARWARFRDAVPARRAGLGLFGFRAGARISGPKVRPTAKSDRRSRPAARADQA